ncbi:hypothetical protein ACFY8B_11430 [Streptomyces sp. NPDC012751]|uniref:hypothetical protein n=1 Tax=Streptomyces sp. NPDC012751 TaxID=3364846 RepID=UPI0036C3098C
MGSDIVAALKEGFATAPGITAIDLAVLTRLPDTQRLGFVAYGRWTRQAIESTPWREPEDALRFRDLGQDVACSVTTTASGNLSNSIKPLETSRVPGLQDLLDHAQDEPGAGEPSLADLDVTLGAGTPSDDRAPLTDSYRIKPFVEWKQETSAGPPPVPVTPPALPSSLIPGQVPQRARKYGNLRSTAVRSDPHDRLKDQISALVRAHGTRPSAVASQAESASSIPVTLCMTNPRSVAWGLFVVRSGSGVALQRPWVGPARPAISPSQWAG